ncbi:MAG: hypothetical protein ABTQ31_20390 [Rhizobiaceae bacterium]
MLNVEMIRIADLKVSKVLADFVSDEVLPGTGIEADRFLAGFSAIVSDLAPQNRALLKTRDLPQGKIDVWRRSATSRRQYFRFPGSERW